MQWIPTRHLRDARDGHFHVGGRNKHQVGQLVNDDDNVGDNFSGMMMSSSLARIVRSDFPGVAILLLSAHIEVDEALELLNGGTGVGYLLKSRVTDVVDFVESVQRVARGGSVIDPGLVSELVTGATPERPAGRAHPAGTGGPGGDGRGLFERRHRPAAVRQRGHRGEARAADLSEAPALRDGGRPPQGAGGPRLSGRSLGRSRCRGLGYVRSARGRPSPRAGTWTGSRRLGVLRRGPPDPASG